MNEREKQISFARTWRMGQRERQTYRYIKRQTTRERKADRQMNQETNINVK